MHQHVISRLNPAKNLMCFRGRVNVRMVLLRYLWLRDRTQLIISLLDVFFTGFWSYIEQRVAVRQIHRIVGISEISDTYQGSWIMLPFIKFDRVYCIFIAFLCIRLWNALLGTFLSPTISLEPIFRILIPQTAIFNRRWGKLIYPKHELATFAFQNLILFIII